MSRTLVLHMAQASALLIRRSLRERITFVALVLVTIAVGLAVHWHGTMFPPAVRDVLADALWAMMIGWSLGALRPDARIGVRAALALGICWAVECSQLYHAPALDNWRRTAVGHLVLGSDFSVRDLGAYALGVLAIVLLETAVRRRRGSLGA